MNRATGQTTDRWRATLGPAADVQAADRIAWNGITFEVDGSPQRWFRRRRPHHLEVSLLIVEQG